MTFTAIKAFRSPHIPRFAIHSTNCSLVARQGRDQDGQRTRTRSRTAVCRLAALPIRFRARRVFVKAHWSVCLPEAQAREASLLFGAQPSGAMQTEESIALRAPPVFPCVSFLPPHSARLAGASGPPPFCELLRFARCRRWYHQPAAPWPLPRLPLWPFARRHKHTVAVLGLPA